MNVTLARLVSALTAIAFLALAPQLAGAQSALDDALDEIDKAVEDAEAALGATPAITTVKSSYSCQRHETMHIDGKKLASNKLGGKKEKLVINASGHCNVLLKNIEITGVTAINASGHANVFIKNSTVRGKVAIVAAGHVNIVISEKSNIEAEKTALLVSGHAKVSVVGSSVTGKRIASVSGFALVSVDATSTTKGKVSKSGRARYIKR